MSRTMKKDGATVKVVVRVRPANEKEMKAASPPVVQVQSQDNSVTVVKGSGKTQQRHVFAFDHVFGTYATQKDIFEQTLAPIVDDVMSGVESTVFAYGQTGTGKTYTMEGEINSEDHKGVIPRAVEAIFRRLDNKKYLRSDVAVSFLEIYNEDLTDLLSNETRLSICTNGEGKVVCKGLSQQPIATSTEVLRVLKQAQQRRQTGETNMNKQSSRSHCLFTLQVRSVERVGDCDLERTGKLHLVDLAGSECAKATGATGSRLRESQNINQSLLTLGRVISALREKSPRIPYRDSKLTRLLSEALGGACRTCIIATLSPSALCAEESMSTLHYARRAHGIKNKSAAANIRMSVNGPNGQNSVSVAGSQTFLEMQARLDYMENQCLEAQTALARQHEANVALSAEMEKVAAKEAQTRQLYEETCVALEATKVTLAKTQNDLNTQTSFTTSLQDTLHKSVETLNKFATDEANGRKDLSNKVDSSISEHKATIEKMQNTTAAILSTVEAKNAELSSLLNNFTSTNTQALQDCVSEQAKLSQSLHTSVTDGFKELQTSIEASSETFRTAEDQLATWGTETKTAFEGYLSSLEAKLDEQKASVDETSEFFQSHMDNHLEKFAQRQKALDGLSKAARRHEKLGSQHLQSLDSLTQANRANFEKLTQDLSAHLEFVSEARSARANGQQDEELLASVADTTATLLAGAKGSLASLDAQRELLTNALQYHKEHTADGVLQSKLDEFTASYSNANGEESNMLTDQIAALESTTTAQVDGTIDEAHLETISTAASEMSQKLNVQNQQLASLVEFQGNTGKQLVESVVDALRTLLTSKVTELTTGVEQRVDEAQQSNSQLNEIVGQTKDSLTAETTTWANNNAAVVESLQTIKSKSETTLNHVAETKTLVSAAIDDFSTTTKAWGEANRDVDSKMEDAVEQNKVMCSERNTLTKSLQSHIANTTSEAESWAATGNTCDEALAEAEDTIKAHVKATKKSLSTHNKLFNAANKEAVKLQKQADQNIADVDELAEAVVEATELEEKFQSDVGAKFKNIADQHSAFVSHNSEVHASINSAIDTGLAPRADVRAKVDDIRTQMETDMASQQTEFHSASTAQQAQLSQAMESCIQANSQMQTAASSTCTVCNEEVTTSKATADGLCASIVDEQLKKFEQDVASHNETCDEQVSTLVKTHTTVVTEAVAATSTLSESPATIESTEDATETNSRRSTASSTSSKSEEDSIGSPTAASDSEDAENASPKVTNARKTSVPSKRKKRTTTGAARKSTRVTKSTTGKRRSGSASSIPVNKRALRPRATSSSK